MVDVNWKQERMIALLEIFLFLCTCLLSQCSIGIAQVKRIDKDKLDCSANGVSAYFFDESGRKVRECVCAPGFDGDKCQGKVNIGEYSNAARDGNAELIEIYWKKRDLDTEAMKWGEVLKIAAANGRLEVVKKLLEFGISVDFANGATWRDYEELHLKYIIDDSVMEMSRDGGEWESRIKEEGITPLMMACKYGREDVVFELLKRGADVQIRTLNGRSALMFAAASGKERIVGVLIEKGADVKVADLAGDNALMYSMAGRNRKIIEMLVSNGVNPYNKNTHGISPLDFLEEQGDIELKRYTISIAKKYEREVMAEQ